MEKNYLQFIAELKRNIVQSRYIAARLANREQLLLYFKTGKMLSEKIAAEKWGAKVVEQIACDLQVQLPGLRGFSYRNLKNMRQFFEIYKSNLIGEGLSSDKFTSIGQLTTAQLEAFWGISFTHHILLLNKCRSFQEKLFYMEQIATQFWSVSILEHYIEANLFSQQGKLPNNFSKTLSEELKPSALKVFQDEYLMDFISAGGEEDERVFEDKVVADIKSFILRIGKGGMVICNALSPLN